MNEPGQARPGKAGLGAAERGKVQLYLCNGGRNCNAAWLGRARQGLARRGAAGHGPAERGKVQLYLCNEARPGAAGQG